MTATLDGICEKILIASCEDSSDIRLAQIHSGVLKNCHFHVFAVFGNSRRQPSCIAQWYEVERTPSTDHSD